MAKEYIGNSSSTTSGTSFVFNTDLNIGEESTYRKILVLFSLRTGSEESIANKVKINGIDAEIIYNQTDGQGNCNVIAYATVPGTTLSAQIEFDKTYLRCTMHVYKLEGLSLLDCIGTTNNNSNKAIVNINTKESGAVIGLAVVQYSNASVNTQFTELIKDATCNVPYVSTAVASNETTETGKMEIGASFSRTNETKTLICISFEEMDLTPPIITGVSDGVTYTTSVTPIITDDNLANITLNGVPFESGTEISENGTYTLIAEDKSGNTTTIIFVINIPNIPEDDSLSKFKDECKKGAYHNRLGQIIVDGVEEPITHSNNLSSFTIEDGCYVDGNIIGTTYLKKLTAQFVSIPQNVDLIDKTIYAKIGVKYADLSEEWLEMGKYTVERPKDEQTADLTQITTYDDFNKLDKPYICNLDFENDVTIGDYYIDVCNQLELIPKKTTFINSDIPVSANPFVNNETLRFVLQEIEKVACSFSEIDFSTNEIDLVWLSQNEEPDYEFETSDYSTLEGGKIVYGPVNSLVLKYSQIEGENATIEDEESIATNGETQLTIEDSYFLFTEDLKWQAINKIWERVKGLTYTDCKLTSYYGKPFLKVGQKIRVHTNDGRVFDTYVLKHTFTYDGTFQSIIESPVLTKQETRIKNKSISEAIRITEIKVDKANGQITATTKKTQELEDNLNNNYYSKTNVNELIQTAETGVTNTFSEAGGNNVLRNTGLWFKSSEYIDTLETINAYNPETEYYYCDYNPINSNITAYEQTLDTTYGLDENNNLSRTNVRCGDEYLIEIIDGVDYQIKIDSLGFLAVDDGNYSLNMFYLDSELKPISEPLENPTKEVTGVQVSSPITTTTTNLTIPENAKYMFPFLTKGFLGNGTQIDLETVKNGLSSLQVTYTTGTRETIEGYEYWEGNVAKGTNDKAVNYTSLLLQDDSLSQEQEVPNGNYSISFFYQKLNQFANASVVINDKEYLLDSLSVKQFYTGEQDNETGEYITQPIVVTSNHIKIEFKCDISNGVEVWDLMCNKGAVKLAYSQNENETTTETVNISKGITITSSNAEAIFKANANGIKILTLQEETIAYFTDKGMSTKEIVVEDEAQICGTLVQEVDGQTWFTRM